MDDKEFNEIEGFDKFYPEENFRFEDRHEFIEILDDKMLEDQWESQDEEQWHDQGEEQYPDSDEAAVHGKRGKLYKATALIVLVTFFALSFIDFSYLLSGKWDFLSQNKDLTEDEIVSRCKPAVVSVEAAISRGTGFNISPDGVIITNKHVVAGLTQITVRFGDGRTFYTDTYQSVPNVDIAILRIDGDGQNLPFIEINREEPVKSGEMVTIIGNPLGFEKISQRGRVGSYHRIQDSGAAIFDIKIPINPGNSGSPVLNSRGQAVGIVFASADISVDGKMDNGEESRALAFPIRVLPE